MQLLTKICIEVTLSQRLFLRSRGNWRLYGLVRYRSPGMKSGLYVVSLVYDLLRLLSYPEPLFGDFFKSSTQTLFSCFDRISHTLRITFQELLLVFKSLNSFISCHKVFSSWCLRFFLFNKTSMLLECIIINVERDFRFFWKSSLFNWPES